MFCFTARNAPPARQPHFYENEYRYKLSGKTLTFTKVKNQCPDEVALTILTSQPWTKAD